MKILNKAGFSTPINIVGMSVAFAAALILMVQVRRDAGYDKNFPSWENLYRMENNFMDDGLFSTYFSRPLIQIARNASSNIENIGTSWGIQRRIYHREGNKNSPVTVSSAQVDSAMLSVFPLEWQEGSAEEFTARGTAIVSASVSKLFFGSETSIGKILETDSGQRMRIVGVFKDTPRNFSMHCDLMENIGDRFLNDNQEWSFNAFVKLKDHTLAMETQNLIVDAYKQYFGGDMDEEKTEIFKKGFRLSRLHEAHYERDVRASEGSANKGITITLAAIAILLIIIAIINFVNFAFAQIPFHIKAINTRKVLGESRTSLIGRQLVSAGIIALTAFVLSLALVHLVSGTTLSSYVSASLKLKDNLGLIALAFGLSVVSAVIAGIAPAMYSTSQPAALVLKGSYAMSVKGKGLRNALVALQFVLSFVFILMALFVNVQTKFMMRRDMGFQRENVLQSWCGYIAGAQHEALSEKLMQNSAITDVTFADNQLVSMQKMGWGRTEEDGKRIFMEVLPVTDNFLDFFGLKVLEGRNFLPSDNQSEKGCFIVNENFIRSFPFCHVGSFVGAHKGNAEIVAIVKDFNFKPLQHPISPLALFIWGKTQWRNFPNMYVKIARDADFDEVSAYIRKAVCSFDGSLEPDRVTVEYLDEWTENMYMEEKALGRLISIASLVALLISIIGIIGLVFFETQFLRKEIAVRRVNGATVGSILRRINRQYLLIAGAGFVIAAPLAYWIMLVWRGGFAYQAPVPLWVFILAAVFVAIITVLVVSLQSLRAAVANPVESLKND